MSNYLLNSVTEPQRQQKKRIIKWTFYLIVAITCAGIYRFVQFGEDIPAGLLQLLGVLFMGMLGMMGVNSYDKQSIIKNKPEAFKTAYDDDK